MKLIAVLFTILALTVVAEKYSTENDDLNIDSLSDPQLKDFLDCFIHKAPCKPVQAQFKEDLPEAIKETCAKCTDAQKIQIKKFLEKIIRKYPMDYQVFSKIYDPDSKHLVALQSMLSKL